MQAFMESGSENGVLLVSTGTLVTTSKQPGKHALLRFFCRHPKDQMHAGLKL